MISAEVYVIIEESILNVYKRPNSEYLENVCKTLSASIFLKSGPFEEKKIPIKLKVFNGAEGSFDFEH